MNKTNVVSIDPAQLDEQEQASAPELVEISHAMPMAFLALCNKFAAARGDVRYYLNGVLIEAAPDYFTVVATDGHRLSAIRGTNNPVIGEKIAETWGDAKPEGTLDLIVPGDKIKQHFGSYSAAHAKAVTGFTLRQVEGAKPDSVKVEGQLDNVLIEGIEGRFPDWRRVTPEMGAETDRQKWIKAELEAQAPSVDFQCSPQEAQDLHDDLAALQIGFNCGYVADAMTMHKCLEKLRGAAGKYQGVRMTVRDNASSVRFDSTTSQYSPGYQSTSVDESELAFASMSIVMPMRI